MSFAMTSDISAFRARLNRGFRELRKAGYFARQSFWCCQSCACAAIPEESSEKYVFYHKQDAENRDEQGSCYLAWAGDAKEIRTILEAAGLHVVHDGSESTRILVSASPEA